VRRAARRRWLACSTLELVALGAWIGGLLVIVGAVIPAVFNSFGMEPGGRFLTRVFDGYNRMTVAAMAVLAASAAVRLWAERRGWMSGSAPGRAETLLLTGMVAVGVLIILVLGPQAVALQETAFASRDEGARKLAYDAFFRTHRVLRGLYVLNLGLGVALLAVKVSVWTGSGGGEAT
jgi:uncharacterized membrane protein